jgi:CheY-like chemotaxis protein
MKNVLLIDDDTDDIDLFSEAVSNISPEIRCWSAKDGSQGLRLLNEELVVLPDYIFLDVNMPVMGGKECLARIKTNSRLRTIPVFMYSTTSNATEIQEMKKLGAKDFVIKPSDFNSLVRLLKSVFLSGSVPRGSFAH